MVNGSRFAFLIMLLCCYSNENKAVAIPFYLEFLWSESQLSCVIFIILLYNSYFVSREDFIFCIILWAVNYEDEHHEHNNCPQYHHNHNPLRPNFTEQWQVQLLHSEPDQHSLAWLRKPLRWNSSESTNKLGEQVY